MVLKWSRIHRGSRMNGRQCTLNFCIFHLFRGLLIGLPIRLPEGPTSGIIGLPIGLNLLVGDRGVCHKFEFNVCCNDGWRNIMEIWESAWLVTKFLVQGVQLTLLAMCTTLVADIGLVSGRSDHVWWVGGRGGRSGVPGPGSDRSWGEPWCWGGSGARPDPACI